MSFHDIGCALRFRTMTVVAALGTAAALISPPASADSTIKASAFGRGTVVGGEYHGLPFTVTLVGEYSAAGNGTMSNGAGTVVVIGTERFEGVVSPDFGTFQSLCCGEGHVNPGDYFSMTGQVRHVTAAVPHNHLFGASATASGALCFNIADQSGTIVTPIDPPHDPGISLVCDVPAVVAIGSTPSGRVGVPFGFVDTPLQNSTGITGSIAVTGWALDDLGVTAVRIVRDPVADEPGGQRVPVGNAVLVAGARPDVAASYPSHPNSTRAGWGYLMLTNMLPNQGNGTFTFHIFADDANGNATLLGSRTITCANGTATTPFGAIDTPAQGETVAGVINNFGWVLSPGARRADPPGGGSVSVVIDGVPAGSPSGWVSRSDLAALFPAAQYSGVNFALGVLTLNSAALTNGVHTIAWVVTDSHGGAAGVGSRYFTVANGTAVTAQRTYLRASRHPGLVALGPVLGRRGFDFNAPLRRFSPNASGVVVVHAEELDRIELRLRASAGRLQPGSDLEGLPPGARIDPQSGTFTWQPGPGFIGPYDWVFDTSSGERRVRVVLHPKQSNRVGPQVVIDAPVANAEVIGSFTVGGWAADLDAQEGTGINTAHVWAYPDGGGKPIFLGAAEYGGWRPDVAAIHGNRVAWSGFGLRVDALPAGVYDLAVFAYATAAGGFLPARTARVTVR